MKKTPAAATVAALLGLAGTANAADLYPGGSLKDAAPAFVPPTTWTGFYLGGHIGGFWTDNKYTDNGYYDNTWNENFVDPSPHSWNDNQSGVFGGGQLGYNFQSGAFVFGVEADFGVIDLNHQHVLYTMTRGDNYWSKEDGSFYADVTGRIGYAVGPALFYAKGGWAFFDDRSSFGGTCYDHPDIPGGYSWSAGRSGLDGWVVGGGIEYLWSPS